MDRLITPLRAASVGVLLIALWLIVLGILHAVQIPFVLLAIPKMGLTVTYVTVILIVLWKMLPLGIGSILFKQHRTVIHWFSGTDVSKDGEQDDWSNTPLLATLLIGLLGLLFVGRGLQQFCNDWSIELQILVIDNPEISGVWQQFLPAIHPSPTPLLFCPIVIGLVFMMGARRLGNLFGRQIDKSLENPLEEEEGNLS